jgi:hypothetical protein
MGDHEEYYQELFEVFPERVIHVLVFLTSATCRYVTDHSVKADWRSIKKLDFVDILSRYREKDIRVPELPSFLTGKITGPTPPAIEPAPAPAPAVVQQGPPIHVHIDGATLGSVRGKGTADAGGGPTKPDDGNIKVFRLNKRGDPAGEDKNLRSKLGQKSAGWKLVSDYQDELPKFQSKCLCVNFIVTGSCFKKCNRGHPNENETTAEMYSAVEKVCQKIGASGN